MTFFYSIGLHRMKNRAVRTMPCYSFTVTPA